MHETGQVLVAEVVLSRPPLEGEEGGGLEYLEKVHTAGLK